MKIKAIIRHIGLNDDWVEGLKVSSKGTAESEIKEIISEFNYDEGRRYGDKAKLRELVSVGDVIVESRAQKTKLQSDYNFFTDKPISEILCDNCEYKADCKAEPPCMAYVYLCEI
jgi:hypothetical protein